MPQAAPSSETETPWKPRAAKSSAAVSRICSRLVFVGAEVIARGYRVSSGGISLLEQVACSEHRVERDLDVVDLVAGRLAGRSDVDRRRTCRPLLTQPLSQARQQLVALRPAQMKQRGRVAVDDPAE